MLAGFAVFISLSSLALGTVLSDVSAASSEYDFIIVGGGLSGCLLASELSANPDVKVLVVEAGPSNANIETLEVPLLAGGLGMPNTWDWNFTTVAQPGLFNRSLEFSRGKVLGGTSSLNTLIFTRGSKDDYSRLAEYSGNSDWTWDNLFPYMKAMEGFVQPADHHNTTGEYNPAFHGTTGPLHLTLGGFPSPLDPIALEASHQTDVLPFIEDANTGYPLGISWQQLTVDVWKRSSSATAFLPNTTQSRSNLHILLETTVTKILSSGKKGPDVVFDGVSVASNSSSPSHVFKATKEVILSAGSISTPQILLISGIGNSTELSKFNITTVLENPNVGQHLQDHILLENHFTAKSSWDDFFLNSTMEADALAEWNATHTGVMVDIGANLVGWGRVPANSSIWQYGEDPSAGPGVPHYEHIPVNLFADPVLPMPSSGNYMTFHTNLHTPASRGSISIASADPFADPLIDPAYYSNPIDIQIMMASITRAREYLSTPAFQAWIGEPLNPAWNADLGSSDLETYVRNSSSSMWHPIGSARMVDTQGQGGVVDNKLLVVGAKGLRIVDASVIPFEFGAHPQAPLYAITARTVDNIKSAWGLH